MSGPEEQDRERRRIIRRITLITWGLGAAAVVLAVLGGALLAWVLMGAGWPFLRSWLIISLLLLLVPLAVHLAPWPKGKRDGEG